MNILFLSPVGFFKGGAERSLFDLLSNPDITPILLAPEDGALLDKGRELGIECVVLPFGSINDIHRPFSFADGLKAFKSLLSAASELKRLSKKYDAKIVHSNGLKAHAINCFSRCLGGARSVIHIRDIPYTKSEIIVWHILRILCNRMIIVSRACWPKEKLSRKVKVIHNGTPLVENKTIPAKSIGPESPITFGFCGRIHPAKGLHLLLDWISAARKKGINAQLSIRGSFSEDAPEYEKEITEQIKRLSLEEFVEFTGFIKEPSELYNGLDIVVVPSKTPDPLPRSVMESMARGIPVFGYPAGGITEMIEDAQTGFLVKDKESFLKAIETIEEEPSLLGKMIEKGIAKIAKEFSINGLHKQMTAEYTQLTRH